MAMTYKVVRLWPDKKWHIEGKGLSKTKALNLKFKLLKSTIILNPDHIKVICEEDIFDVICHTVNGYSGGIGS